MRDWFRPLGRCWLWFGAGKVGLPLGNQGQWLVQSPICTGKPVAPEVGGRFGFDAILFDV